MPKPEKADKYESDKDLRTLAKNTEGKELTIKGIKYKIETFDKKQYILKADEPSDKLGKNSIIEFEYNDENKIPLYTVNKKTGKKTLNYEFFRSLTESTGKKQ